MENIKGIFLALGGTFREVCENRAYSLAARKRIAEICGTDMDPDDYYEFLNARYDVYRDWALKYYCEAPEKYLWTRWLVPELDRDYIAAHAVELTHCFRNAKGERLVVPGGVETVKELIARGYKIGIISDLVGTEEIDQWLDADGVQALLDGKDPKRVREIGEEFADVMMYGLQLMRALDIDVSSEIERKIGIVLKRPAGVRGRDIPQTEDKP